MIDVRNARLEIEGTSPVRGWIEFESAEPQEFVGWGELRQLILGGAGAPRAPLTDRELRVVSLACEGLSNARIAETLVLSPRTVQWHLNRAFKKLGVRSRTELVVGWMTSDD